MRIEFEQRAGGGVGLGGRGLAVAAAAVVVARDLAPSDVSPRGSERRGAHDPAAGKEAPPGYARRRPLAATALLRAHLVSFRDMPMIASCMYSGSRCKGK